MTARLQANWVKITRLSFDADSLQIIEQQNRLGIEWSTVQSPHFVKDHPQGVDVTGGDRSLCRVIVPGARQLRVPMTSVVRLSSASAISCIVAIRKSIIFTYSSSPTLCSMMFSGLRSR